jgi:hypothetical protein
VTSNDLQQLVLEFYRERLALLMRHERSAQVMGDYDINNAYQTILAREETQVSWLHHALLDLGVEVPAEPAPLAENARKGPSASDVAREDARLNQEFVTRWRDRVETMTQARHRGMLRVILGEMGEHRRLFEQAAAGHTGLMGTALAINERVGQVLPNRWMD